MSLTRLFVQRPTLVTVLLALVLLAGWIGGSSLVQQQFPSTDVPSIQVLLTYPGASTTEMRDAIVRPLEDQLSGTPNLDHLETSIQPGQASIVAVFTLTSDQNDDLVQVQGRLQNAQHQIPNDVQTPQISLYNPSEAVVVSLVLRSRSLSVGSLSSLAINKIVPSLEQIPGVSYVQANGTVTPSIQVNVDPQRLSSSGFTLTDIISTITNNNVRAPGGILYAPNRETNLDVRGDIQDVPTVADLLLGSSGGSANSTTTNPWTTQARLYHIGDVADVQDAYETQRAYAYSDGEPCITLDIQKSAGTSEIQTSNDVIKALPELQRTYPDIDFSVLNVQSDYTKAQLADVRTTLIEAIVFTGIVMLFFLHSWRNAIAVMIAIPTSLLVTLAAMKIAHFTLDTVSLLAMTLIIGILVDDSIVVLENIDRHFRKGEQPFEAAVKGREEIGIAAIVITLVDVVVFLPISFLPGSVGLFLREFGLVVTVATLTSLFVSFTVTPTLAAHWVLSPQSQQPSWPFAAWFKRLRGVYWKISGTALILAATAILLFVAAIIGVIHYLISEPTQIETLLGLKVYRPLFWFSIPLFIVGMGTFLAVTILTVFTWFMTTQAAGKLWTRISQPQAWFVIRYFTTYFERLRASYTGRLLPWGLAHGRTVALISVVSLVAACSLIPLGLVGFEYIPPVDRGEIYVTMTFPSGTPLETTRQGLLKVEKAVNAVSDVRAESSTAGEYLGQITGYIQNGAIAQIDVYLNDKRAHATTYWAAQLQSQAQRILPGATVVAVPATDISGGNAQPIDEVISSVDGQPEKYAAQVEAALKATPGTIDVSTSAADLSPQVEVQFNRDHARALGTSIGTASTAVRAAFGGDLATQFTGADGLKDVMVIYPQSQQTSLAAIENIPIRANDGSIIHVGDIAKLAQAPAPPMIMRINRQSVVYVGANLAPGATLSNVQRDFARRLSALHLPSTVSVQPSAGGNEQQVGDTVSGMTVALGLSILLVYLLMVALYNSYRTPFIIMFAVPVAVVGALSSLALTHQTLNLFSLIGSVLLIGLVTKNGILLVDFANMRRREGMDRTAAIRAAASERFRPIMMTTIAMISGMLPLALVLDPGAQAARSLGIVVIGGLASSLLLTLLLVPVVYIAMTPETENAVRADGS